MSTMILSGTKGIYNKTNERAVFTVSADTCMSSNNIPVKFNNAADGCIVKMKDVTFTRPIKTCSK